MAADTKEPAAQRPLEKAAERIRASAQSILTAFAAVGALLAAGLQLGSIGDLTVDDCARFSATIVGYLAGVVGVVWAIAAAATVATRSSVSLKWLTTHPNSLAATTVNNDPVLRRSKPLDRLDKELQDASAAANATWDEIIQLGDPGSDTTKKDKAQELAAQLAGETASLRKLEAIRADVLEVASFFRVKQAYDDARVGMAGGAILAAVGLALFAWGSNAPDATHLDAGEVLPKTPSEVTVILTDTGASNFADTIGEDCDPTSVAAIAFAVDGDAYTVTSERTDDCNVATFTVDPEEGAVIPRADGANGDTTATTTAAG